MLTHEPGSGHDETSSSGNKEDDDDDDDDAEDKIDPHQYDPERLKAFNVNSLKLNIFFIYLFSLSGIVLGYYLIFVSFSRCSFVCLWMRILIGLFLFQSNPKKRSRRLSIVALDSSRNSQNGQENGFALI